MKYTPALTLLVLLVILLTAPSKQAQQSQILFKTETHQTFTANSYSQRVWVHGDDIYVVWVNPKLQGCIAKIKADGSIEQAVIIPKHLNDTHNGIQLGIDSKGYLHIAGDMHHSPLHGKRPKNRDHLDIPWQYWISKKPGDIHSFEFAGDSKRAPAGTRLSYAHFYKDQKSNLYLVYRNGIIGKGYVYGILAGTVARWDQKKQSWDTLAGKSSFGIPATVWTDQGIAKGVTGYQAYKLDLVFDRKNHMHLVWTNFGKKSPRIGSLGAQYLLYAKSEDGGKTWKKARGTRIRKLPITHTTGDLIAEGDGEGRDFASKVSISLNHQEQPVVYYTMDGQPYSKAWNPKTRAWSAQEKSRPRGGFPVIHDALGNQYHIERGRLWKSKDSGKNWTHRPISGLGESATGQDRFYNAQQKNHLILLTIDKERTLSVVKVKINE